MVKHLLFSDELIAQALHRHQTGGIGRVVFQFFPEAVNMGDEGVFVAEGIFPHGIDNLVDGDDAVQVIGEKSQDFILLRREFLLPAFFYNRALRRIEEGTV